jgi:RHS repeat-associated protein
MAHPPRLAPMQEGRRAQHIRATALEVLSMYGGMMKAHRTVRAAAAVILAASSATICTAPAEAAAPDLQPRTAALLSAAPNLPKGLGPARNATFLTFSLADRLELKINVASGNLLVRSTDITLPGVRSQLILGSAYNSLLLGTAVQTGSLGHGWRTRFGADVRLYPADDATVTFVAPDGTVGVFQPSGTGYTSPGEFKATLAHDGSGWKLTDHGSGQVLTFLSSGLLDKLTDRNGNVIDVAYDANGRQSQITGDTGPATIRAVRTPAGSNGFIASLQQTSTAGTTRTLTYTYDSAGNLTRITDPIGKVFTFGYDAGHQLTSIQTPTTETPTSATVTYDSQHRVTALTRLWGTKSTNLATTRLSYVSTTQTQVADANTDQAQPVSAVPHTTYTFNSDKRVTQTTDPAGNSRSKTYTPFQDVATSTTAEGGTTTNTYGANGGESVTQSVSPTGTSASFAYANPATPSNPTANFQPSSTTDGQGNASLFTYDGAGNRSSTTNATAAKASVAYNSDGTVKSSTDPANGTNSTTYGYDADKQLTTITPPTGNTLGIRRFTYDAFGRIATADDGRGKVSTFGYDLDDRITSTGFNDGTVTVTMTYDGSGRLVKRIDGQGITTFTYDKMGRLLTRGNTAGGPTLTYKYDLVGNLTALSDGRGTTSYTYDSRNLLTQTVNSDHLMYAFAYDKDGRRTQTYFNTVAGTSTWTTRTTTAYDKSGRITRITTARNSNPNDKVYDVSYCYSAFVSGQPCSTAAGSDSDLRRWQRDELTATITVYNYDTGNRLTHATNVGGNTYDYAYDANGNRTSVITNGVTTQSLTFNSANQITTAGYAYDAAGNQTASPAGAAAYNAAEQATQMSGTAYAYAGADQTELLSAGSEGFVYGHDDQYSQPWLQSYTNSQTDVYVERDAHGTPLGMRTSANDFTFVLDGIGSVVAVIAADGSVAARYVYDPFGVTLSATESGLVQTNVVRFAGGIYDPVTKLVKFGKRWYDPALGRFTQQDSLNLIGDPARGNRYAYAGCNPVTTIDPTGQLSQDCVIHIVATVVGVVLTELAIFATPVTWVSAGIAYLTLLGTVVTAQDMIEKCGWDKSGED